MTQPVETIQTETGTGTGMLDYADRRHGAILARPVWVGWAAMSWLSLALGWAVVGAAIIGVLVLLVALVSGSRVVSGASPALGMLLLAAMGAAARGARRARATTVLGYVEQAV